MHLYSQLIAILEHYLDHSPIPLREVLEIEKAGVFLVIAKIES
jgi:uncharacterized protein (DUF2249 family)